jgi:hypothetical protein
MYSKGISWFYDCRIPFVDENINFERPRVREKKEWVYELGITWENPDVKEYNTKGRFPANLLVCDDMLNDGVITKQTKWNKIHNDSVGGTFGGGNMNPNNSYGDKGTNSRYYDIDKWFDNIISE